MRMIHKMNLMDVLIQVDDILFNIDRKEKKEGMFWMRQEGTLWYVVVGSR
jgi:hypothetical protein